MSDVRAEFEATPGFDPLRVSIRDLRDALSQCGLETEAVESSSGLNGMPRPCILYFRPGKWIRGPQDASSGHFVTLLGISDGAVDVADWAPLYSEARITVPIEVIRERWDGEAVIPSRSGFGQWPVLSCVVALAAGVVWFLRKSRADHLSRLAILTAAVGTAACQGCGESPSDIPSSPVRVQFDQHVVNHGVIKGGPFEVAFPFRVQGDSPIALVGFDASCGCMAISDELFNRPLGSVPKRWGRVF